MNNESDSDISSDDDGSIGDDFYDNVISVLTSDEMLSEGLKVAGIQPSDRQQALSLLPLISDPLLLSLLLGLSLFLVVDLGLGLGLYPYFPC